MDKAWRIVFFVRLGTTILARGISAEPRIEWQTMHCSRGEHSKIQFVWIHPGVIRFKTALPGYAFSIEIVLLLWLLRPRKEETTSAAASRFYLWKPGFGKLVFIIYGLLKNIGPIKQ